jgi:hypothetical protein
MIGIRITLTTIISRFNGTPDRTKSLKRYPPGPNTIMCVWYPTGEAKAKDDARATAITNGRG